MGGKQIEVGVHRKCIFGSHVADGESINAKPLHNFLKCLGNIPTIEMSWAPPQEVVMQHVELTARIESLWYQLYPGSSELEVMRDAVWDLQSERLPIWPEHRGWLVWDWKEDDHYSPPLSNSGGFHDQKAFI